MKVIPGAPVPGTPASWSDPPSGEVRSAPSVACESLRSTTARGRAEHPPVQHDEEPQGRQRRVRRQRDHGSRGTRGGPQAPRHVHRLHRRARPAPPGLRGRRQLRRRGARRLLRPHRGHAARRRRRARRRQRPRHPGRHPPDRGPADRRGRHDDPARGRQVRRRGLRGLRRSARRRHLRGERAVHARRDRGQARRLRLAAGLLRRRQAAGRAAEGRADRRDRHVADVLGRPDASSRPPSTTSRRCARASSSTRSSTRACRSR